MRSLVRNAEGFTLENGLVRMRYFLKTADWEVEFPASNAPATGRIGFAFRWRGRMYENTDLAICEAEITETGTRFRFGPIYVLQEFILNDDSPYILTRLTLCGKDIIESNYLCPLLARGTVCPLPGANGMRVLCAPYDNDKWCRYRAARPEEGLSSYAFTAVYDDDTRKGYVVGAVTHDDWKTGLRTHGGYGALSEMHVFGGAADINTRDLYQPHGAVRGREIKSPLIMLGYYDDFREGMREYGRVNARYCPAPKWEGGVVFGWNSWACLAGNLSFPAFDTASAALRELTPLGFENNGVQYINFDAAWNRLSEEEIKAAVTLTHGRGQKAGIYYAPFAYWGNDLDRRVEGAEEYTYGDLLLRGDDGMPLPALDGGRALDPTHPGNVRRIEKAIARFIEMGFEYLKVDFMAHGACEGVHYLRDVTTGVQAYRYGLDRMCAPMRDKPFFLDFSIAPLFPHGYANARRISCDAFGQIYDTEYMLNALTYSFWQNGTIYNYADPDHTCLYHSFGRPVTDECEARSRLLASVISGTVMLLSDDYADREALNRTKKLITPALMEIARSGGAFLPLECGRGDQASRYYVREDQNRVLLAAFNFDETPATMELPLSRIGKIAESAVFHEVDGDESLRGSVLRFTLPARDCRLYEAKI